MDNKNWLNKEVGNYLKEVRVQSGLSQSDLAKHLGYTTKQFISNIERGTCTASPSIIHNMLKACKVSQTKAVEDLLDIQMKFLSAELKGKKVKAI